MSTGNGDTLRTLHGNLQKPAHEATDHSATLWGCICMPGPQLSHVRFKKLLNQRQTCGHVTEPNCHFCVHNLYHKLPPTSLPHASFQSMFCDDQQTTPRTCAKARSGDTGTRMQVIFYRASLVRRPRVTQPERVDKPSEKTCIEKRLSLRKGFALPKKLHFLCYCRQQT